MNGFFINECVENKTFDPRPATRVNPCYSHTLVGLLYQASPRFRISFEQHLNNLLTADPLTLQNPSEDVNFFLSKENSKSHETDVFNVPSVFDSGAEGKTTRDWNEEF